MRTIVNSRVRKLEDRFGLGDGKPPFFIVLSRTGMALSKDRCIEILKEYGHLSTGPMCSVCLAAIPEGLNAEQTERFLREQGAWLLSPDCLVRCE